MLETLKRGWGSNWDQKKAARGLVCSRLCDRSMILALLDAGLPMDQLQFHTDPKRFVTPAVLSETTRLIEVDASWWRA